MLVLCFLLILSLTRPLPASKPILHEVGFLNANATTPVVQMRRIQVYLHE